MGLAFSFFFSQAEDGIRDHCVTGVQTCDLPISVSLTLKTSLTPLDATATTLSLTSLKCSSTENTSIPGWRLLTWTMEPVAVGTTSSPVRHLPVLDRKSVV